jgi:hypothetical protein
MRATVKHFLAFPDGSGAEALIECDGFTWAFNFLGSVTSHGVNMPQHGFIARPRFKAAHRIAQAEYERQVAALGADWRALNAAMYAEVAHG